MIKENSSSRYRRYEIYTEPRKLISSYALESSASHIAAAKLVMGKQNMAAQGGLKLEQLEAHKREVVSAQGMESLGTEPSVYYLQYREISSKPDFDTAPRL